MGVLYSIEEKVRGQSHKVRVIPCALRQNRAFEHSLHDERIEIDTDVLERATPSGKEAYPP